MKTTNPQLLDVAKMLTKTSKTNNAEIWKTLSEELLRHKHSRTTVNLSRIARHLKEGETAAVPGKVLGSGDAGRISVAAFSFSESARKKIEGKGGECFSFKELVERNPKGSGVRIIG